MRLMSHLPAVIVLSLAVATPVLGQREHRLPPPSTAECAAASSAVRLRGKSYGEALFALSLCPVRGPDALLAEWAAPPTDPEELYGLGDASRTMRDQRLLNRITTMAMADGTPSDLRDALVNVLVGYVAREVWVSIEDGCWEYTVSTASDLVTDGAQPLNRAQTDRKVLEIVRALESRGVLGTKAMCSQGLSQWLEWRINLVRPDLTRPLLR